MEFSVDKKGQTINQAKGEKGESLGSRKAKLSGWISSFSQKNFTKVCVCVRDAEIKALEEGVLVKREENMATFSSQTACWQLHAAQAALMPPSAVPVGERAEQ